MAAKGFSAVFIANEPTANTQYLFSPSPRHRILCTVLKFNTEIERIGWFASSILEKNDLNVVASLNESIGHFAHNMLCAALGIKDCIEVQQKKRCFSEGNISIHTDIIKSCRKMRVSLQDFILLSNQRCGMMIIENGL